MNIYYYCPFILNFNAGATTQVIKDYKYLSRNGYNVFLYGTYDSEDALKEILDYIDKDSVTILAIHKSNRWKRNLIKWKFLSKIIRDRSRKIIVSRNYNKIREICLLKNILGPHLSILELHEDALPHMLAKHNMQKSHQLKDNYSKLFWALSALILTNYSQELILKQEFFDLPPYTILPNGVEIEQFKHVKPKEIRSNDPIVVTYVGQFTAWKNVELLFQAMRHLDQRYVLRIAGGKDDANSVQQIRQWTEKYSLQGRIEFKGFVSPKNLPKDVLDGSSALLLPLGDNIESRYFTSPMKLFEYMATGIPVVAVNYPSIQMITGNYTVFLSENSPEAFAATIENAVKCTDQERIRKTQALANKYSYEVRAKQMHEFLQTLL